MPIKQGGEARYGYDNTDTGAFTPIQKAAAFALSSADSLYLDQMSVYRERRNAVIEGLSAIGIEAEPPRGSFFIWVQVPCGYSSEGFAHAVLEQCGVIVMPGSVFGPSREGFSAVVVRPSGAAAGSDRSNEDVAEELE